MSASIVGLPPGATLQPISPAPQQAIAGLPPGATVKPIGAGASPSGGQPSVAAQTPGVVSRYLASAGAPSTTISDYWKGPGEAILHPELEWESLKNMWQGAGQAQQNLINRAYAEQQSPGWKNRAAGIGHGMEAAIPFVGPAMAKAGDQFSSGDIAGALGSLTQVALAAKGAGESLPKDAAIPEAAIPKKAGFVSTAAKTLGRKAKVEPAIENSLQNFRDDTAKTLNDATKLTRKTIGKTANSLVEADKTVYGDKGNISVAPIRESIEAARQVHTSLAGEKMPLPDKVTAALDQPKGVNISFDDAQKLRTYLGTAVKDAPSHLQGVIKQGYSALSDALSQQASDLDAKLGANGKLSATWENFNKRYSEFAESASGVLRDLSQAKSGSDFSRLLGDKNFRALINRAMMQMHEAGMSPQLLDQWAKISAPLQKAIGGKSGFGGMMGTMYENPIVATGAYEAAPSALGWIPRMVGIVKMAEAIRRVKAMQTVLDNGLDPSIRYTPPIEGGATIGEQLAAKGRTPPKVTASAQNPAPSEGRGAGLEQGGHAGGGVASVEELARPGRFVKISSGGTPSDMGKSPDFGELKPGEAGYQVKPDGTYELRAGQESPATKLGVENYAKEVYGQRAAAEPYPVKIVYNEHGDIVDADGRHRVIAAIDRGDATIPVQTTLKDGTVRILHVDPKTVARHMGVTKESLARTDEQVSEFHNKSDQLTPSEGRASGVSFTEDSNGITWAANPSISRNPVSIPDSIPETDRQAYAEEKLKQQDVMDLKLHPNRKLTPNAAKEEVKGSAAGTIKVEGKDYQIQPDGTLRPLEEVNRQNRVRETVEVARKIEKGERELERLEKMKAHIGSARYEEAVTEISNRLAMLRAQVER